MEFGLEATEKGMHRPKEKLSTTAYPSNLRRDQNTYARSTLFFPLHVLRWRFMEDFVPKLLPQPPKQW